MIPPTGSACPDPCRVLIADDTPEIRLLLRIALETEGSFEVVGEARNGEEALQLAKDFNPDAILLDLAMPVMDGLSAIPHIKEKSPHAKILVLSGFDSGKMRKEAMDAGADGYLEKGEPAQKILSALQDLCA